MTQTQQTTRYDAEIAELEGKFESIEFLSLDEGEQLRDLSKMREGWLEAIETVLDLYRKEATP
jgi:hypothetical protein